MKIAPVSYNQNNSKTNNQPAFGMKITMDAEAIEIAKNWFPKDILEKVMPEIEALKTKNGEEIFVNIVGSAKDWLLKLSGKAENETVEDVVIGSHYGQSTVKGPLNGYVMDDFVPTMKHIKTILDAKISIEKEVDSSEQYLTKMFGKKH